MDSERRQNRVWWLFAGAVAALCLVLGVLQYRWIGEVSQAERERMQGSLRTSLQRLSQDFNGELAAAVAALHPRTAEPNEAGRQEEYLALYHRWKESAPHHQMFKRLALAVPGPDDVELLLLDTANDRFHSAPWPAEWVSMHNHLSARLAGEGFGGPPRFQMRDSLVLELPRFLRPPGDQPGPDGRRQPPRESEWLLLEPNPDYLCNTMLPELLSRHLAGSDYDVAVVSRYDPAKVIFQTTPNFSGNQADATVGILEVPMEALFRRGFGGRFGRGDGPGGGGGPFRRGGPPEMGDRGPGPRPPERGEWTLAARHRSGSLEAVVERGRWRNLAILAGLLVMMLSALGALIRYSERERRLAKLQMDFVAGISHELRTPLSVIRTAAHNLHGGLVTQPKQIQRYGALIRDESERLTGIVEQVLRFAGVQAGRVIQSREPVKVEAMVDEALTATARLTDEAGCLVERQVSADLPQVLADPLALKHALINLIVNATKYGFSGGWIGVEARLVDGAVEITVKDRGPGIALKDQQHVFDAFYRGQRAIEDQIHGTGLGLNLVKRIAEAHDGTVTLKSEPGVGTEFTLRIPAAPARTPEEDEFANTTG